MSTLVAEAQAPVIREWAVENEVPVGSRGRLGPVAKGAFFRANPKVARAVAAEAGIEVPARGRLSDSTIEAVCNILP